MAIYIFFCDSLMIKCIGCKVLSYPQHHMQQMCMQIFRAASYHFQRLHTQQIKMTKKLKQILVKLSVASKQMIIFCRCCLPKQCMLYIVDENIRDKYLLKINENCIIENENRSMMTVLMAVVLENHISKYLVNS